MKGVHPQLLTAISLLVSACGNAPAGTPVQSSAIPEQIGSDRHIEALTKRQIPTLADLKRILPATLTPSEADRQLLTVAANKVLIPSADGRRLVSGNTLHPSWLGPFGLRRFFPFSFFGAPFFSPYFLNPAMGLWSPLAFSPFVGPYGFMASPWLSGCGVMLPYWGNFTPAWIGAAIGTFGCGGGFPVAPWPWL